MNPAFNTFLNIFLNYHRFNNMNEEAKAALKHEQWKEFLETELNNPKAKESVLMSLFKSSDKENKVSRIKFEIKFKVREQMEAMSHTAMLRSKIFNI